MHSDKAKGAVTTHVEDDLSCDAREGDGRATRWEDHRKQRREELLTAARRAIHRGGPQLSMDEIAAAAQTSKSVYYRYFGDKDGLRAAISHKIIERVQAHVMDAGRRASTPADGLTAMILEYLDQAQGSPALYAFVMHPENAAGVMPSGNSMHTDMAAKARNDITSLMTFGLRQVTPHPSSAQFEALWAEAALGFILSAVDHWLTHQNENSASSAQLARAISTWLTHGVLSPIDMGATPQAATASAPKPTASTSEPAPNRSVQGKAH
ncbi:TetR/AcrR family transcriptional regulator [Pseudoglutamicibacter cumminsii]|uniref:TetR/AcrR family transcriptional regulator n=1 Tax=Pseudoglutamicibacter cumminsii TaxID=156979 RepID=UPI00195EDFF7|nr:TetR/AcrR family transcriptional regulator [Pseudoglutamicibacter cumminsii]MBM7796709.1 AcrR family transcriptional regulator [Pseudoglutamicibacter cumminsii]